MRYPYFLVPGQPRNASTPFIKVIYKHATKRTTPMLALVDSGAQVSFAPLDLALWLGVRVDTKKYLDIRGFNNAQSRVTENLKSIKFGLRLKMKERSIQEVMESEEAIEQIEELIKKIQNAK